MPFPYVRNPFGPLTGQPLDGQEVDIAEINVESFRACQRLVQDVAAGGFSAALTVFGDSGTGKTHLLGRVRRWLETQPANLFVFVRMETSPAGIWRHLRRCLAMALLRTGADGSRAMDGLLERRTSDLEMLADRDLSIVLEHLLEGRHVRDAAAWLRGEGLPEDALSVLGLGAPKPDDDPEVLSRQAVLAICGLLQPGVVVFCLDQIEAVRSSPADQDGPHAFGKAVSCLVDETRNAAVISCVQSSFVNLLEQILDNSTKLRLMGRRAVIFPLSWQQAQGLIGARLDTVEELRAERTSHGGCWPLPRAQIRDVFQDNAAPARRIIARCKDLFDQWRSGEAPVVEPLDQALQRMLEERFEAKSAAESDEILRNGVPLLARSVGLNCKTAGEASPMAFLLDGGKVAVALCNETNAMSLASHLKKIGQAWKPAPNRKLVMLRDARIPISRNAKVSQQRIASLEAQGGRLATVSQEALDALAALRRLLSDAESGDLAHHGEAVNASAVEQWIAGHLPASLDPLVAELSPAAGLADVSGRLAALLAEKKLIKLEEAARSLEVSPGEVEECARRDPRQFGILGGSVPVLFQPVSAAEAQYTEVL